MSVPRWKYTRHRFFFTTKVLSSTDLEEARWSSAGPPGTSCIILGPSLHRRGGEEGFSEVGGAAATSSRGWQLIDAPRRRAVSGGSSRKSRRSTAKLLRDRSRARVHTHARTRWTLRTTLNPARSEARARLIAEPPRSATRCETGRERVRRRVLRCACTRRLQWVISVKTMSDARVPVKSPIDLSVAVPCADEILMLILVSRANVEFTFRLDKLIKHVFRKRERERIMILKGVIKMKRWIPWWYHLL